MGPNGRAFARAGIHIETPNGRSPICRYGKDEYPPIVSRGGITVTRDSKVSGQPIRERLRELRHTSVI
jgi:hypothetical protein